MKKIIIFYLCLFLISLFNIACNNGTNNSISKIIINQLNSSNDDKLNSEKLNGFLEEENFPFLIVSDSIENDKNISWSINTVSSEDESVFRDLDNLSLCIEKENSFSYFGISYPTEKYDSISNYYFKNEFANDKESILQISINITKLGNDDWKNIFRYILKYQSLSNKYYKTMKRYYVIGFNQECDRIVIPLPQGELEENITE